MILYVCEWLARQRTPADSASPFAFSLRVAVAESNIPNVAYPTILQVTVTLGGSFLLLGLWTPITGGLLALLQFWVAYSRPDDLWVAILAGAIATGLALIRPGAWSLDARAYGAKRISLRDR